MTLDQLKAQREALQSARFNGVLTVKAGDKWVTYKSDAELQAALSDLEREIAPLVRLANVWWYVRGGAWRWRPTACEGVTGSGNDRRSPPGPAHPRSKPAGGCRRCGATKSPRGFP